MTLSLALIAATATAVVASPIGDVVASPIGDIVESAADYYLSNHTDNSDCGWKRAALMQGVMAAFNFTQKERYLRTAMGWSEAHGWITCNIDQVLSERAAANDMSCGQTYAEVYMHDAAATGTKNDTYIASIRRVLVDLVNRSQVDDWWWVDAYFMAMGTFARLGHITGDTAFHDKNLALYRDSADRRKLWNAESKLYFRDETYMNQTTPSGQRVFWARGEGWAAGALARTLQYTPQDHPAYEVYSARLVALAEGLKSAQNQTDGLWRVSILDPASIPGPETTGSSGITFGLAWGVNNGVLDPDTFRPVVERAWKGLSTISMHKDGFVGLCQPVGSHPEPAKRSDTSDFCVGLFLLAATEVGRMMGE